MPYIKSDNDRREALRKRETAINAGELNYQIFYYVKHSWNIHDRTTTEIYINGFVKNFLGENPNYQRYNDMTGCLIRCYKEIKRRLNLSVGSILIEIMDNYDDEIAKYENLKIKENGDVE